MFGIGYWDFSYGKIGGLRERYLVQLSFVDILIQVLDRSKEVFW